MKPTTAKKDEQAVLAHPASVAEAAHNLALAMEAAEAAGWRVTGPPISAIRGIGVSETAKVERIRVVAVDGDPAVRAAEELADQAGVTVASQPRVTVEKPVPVSTTTRVVEVPVSGEAAAADKQPAKPKG